MSEEKGQVTVATEQPKDVSYADGFDAKWAEIMSIAEEPVEKKAEEVNKPEEECPECEKEKAAKAKAEAEANKKPYRVLKVQGKEVPVYSEEELTNLAQMGVDYTKKRQADADDKRKWESEYQDKHDKLETLAEKFERMFSQGGMPGAKPAEAAKSPEDAAAVTKSALYAEYGIDPEYAEPYQKKMIDNMYNMNQRVSSYDKELSEIKGTTSLIMLEKIAMKIGDIIKDEKESYPYDEIMSEDGKENLTQKQFISLMMAKEKEAKSLGKNVNLEEIARATVRDVHMIQSKAKEAAAPTVTNAMSAEDIEKNYPDLYSKILEKAKSSAVASYEAEKAKLPPSLETRKHEVDISKVSDKKPETMEDWIDAGFKDPEIQALFK